jgi:hypothetical protein
LAEPLQFRDRQLARLPDVDRIQIERGPRKVVFVKTNGTWKMTSPVEVEAEHNALEEFVSDLAKLRADQLVADKPGDLKPYGLDKPEARWLFQSGDKDVLVLMIGPAEKGSPNGGGNANGPRNYAKLGSSDLVFLLDAKLSSKALGEYRSQTVWGQLDAVQVEQLRYSGVNRPSFSLVKQDATWHVDGKPEIKIVAETVSETLDALARLKAKRYIIDKDPDLKLYGLEPPELIVEVADKNGKRALHVGRQEGQSKRYYARVWEGNHSAVFLLSEDDSAVIVRDVMAFTKPPLKPPESKGPKLGAGSRSPLQPRSP